ncbi:MAG: cryptochrome/photolyase family protein, partial [Bdellovibrionales bacterium]
NFYASRREHMKVLVDQDLKPVRGKWSYDAEHRKKIPQDLKIPKSSVEKFNYHTKITEKVKETIDKYFGNHPGESADFCFPVSRKDYEKNFKYFLKTMMNDFGSYQDSITNKSPFLFHSLISPGMNLGLITPEEVTRWTLQWYSKNPDAPLNSVEGFLRQVIGWREFIRGIYQEYSEVQDKKNFFSHKNKMSAHWYRGDTGIPPLDDAIKRALKYSYSHHIDRLMVLSNIMLLCELDPKEVHKWFMELYMDSSDWVMGPNVYGMGQFSDGGIFATKPYISGSNYILKMSDYKKGDWCEVMDGLYWRFVDKNSEFFASNPRMKMMMSALDRMNEEKKKRIFLKAEEFIKKVTK